MWKIYIVQLQLLIIISDICFLYISWRKQLNISANGKTSYAVNLWCIISQNKFWRRCREWKQTSHPKFLARFMKDFLTFVLILLSNNLHLCFPLIRCLVLKSVSYKIARLLRLRFILLNAKVKFIIAHSRGKENVWLLCKRSKLK